MRNLSKKTLKKKACSRYFDAILGNHVPLPMQIVCSITEELADEKINPKFQPLTAYYLIKPPKIRKRFKSSRQDWRFWYYYY